MKGLKAKKNILWFNRFLFALFILCIPITTIFAASKLLLSYDGKSVAYTNSQVKYTWNGRGIDLKGTPGIIIDGHAMASYKNVFKSGFGAACTYDSKTGKITIKKFDNIVEMTLGSKTAYVNGEKKTLKVAPKKVKYKLADVTKVLVPTRFVAESLGYTYKWYSKTGNAAITSTWGEYYIDGAWKKYTGTKAKVTFKDKEIKLGKMPGIILEGATLVRAKKVFSTTMGLSYHYDAEQKKATLKNDKTTIIFTAGSKTALVNGKETVMDTAARKIKNREDNKSYIMVPARFTAETLGYTYDWNSKTKTSVIASESNVNTEGYAIQLLKPENVLESSITTNDLYLQNKFTVTIKGDHTSFYKSNPVVTNSAIVKSTKVTLTSNGNTMLTVTTSKLQGFKLVYKDNYIFVQIANPNKIYKNIVVLDPGHGDGDPGAQAAGYNEKDIAFSILYTCGKKYFNSPTSTLKVYWTRVDDSFVPLNDRAAFAKSVNADIFISLHMNSATATSANGTEVYYSTNNNAAAQSGLTSEKLATYFQKNLVKELDMNNRGVKTAGFVVTKNNTVPAILVELGFLSNSLDREKLVDADFQNASAELLYKLTEDIFVQYPTGR